MILLQFPESSFCAFILESAETFPKEPHEYEKTESGTFVASLAESIGLFFGLVAYGPR